MTRKIILAIFLFAAFLNQAGAQTTPAIVTENSPEESQTRRKTFDLVWKTVNEKHYDPTFGGVDWKKVRQTYEPQALAAKTRDEFHAVLQQMLGELKLSHFGIAPRDAQVQSTSRGGTIGVELEMIDEEAVVSRVEDGSTAAKANLRTGFVVEKIDGKSVADILAPFEKSLAARGRVGDLYRTRILSAALEGAPETFVRIEARGDEDLRQTFNIERRERESEMSPAFGNFPPQPVVFDSMLLAGNVGYIRFNMWTVPQMAKIRAAIRNFAGARGIVFDLRGNPGGIGGMAPGVAGLLVSEQTSLGTMSGRDSEQRFIVYPQASPFAGKVVILTDYGTGSTSEVFAAGLQEIGRAKVVGGQSAGAVLPSVFEILPTGAIFQYAVADYKSPKKVLIEGRGVTPDAAVRQTRTALLAGRDLPLETAVKIIME